MNELKFSKEVIELARKMKDCDIKINIVQTDKYDIGRRFINSSLFKLKILDNDKENIVNYEYDFTKKYINYKKEEGLKHTNKVLEFNEKLGIFM